MNTHSLQVGDKVYVGEESYSRTNYWLGTVIELTPEEAVVNFTPGNPKVHRFNLDGTRKLVRNVRHKKTSSRFFLDEIPFQERSLLLEQEQLMVRVRESLHENGIGTFPTFTTTKEYMESELDRIEEAVAKARISFKCIFEEKP